MLKSLAFALLTSLKAEPHALPYSDGLYVGAGVETTDASVLGSPFEPSTISLKLEDVAMKGNMKMDTV
jgi:hypothetical protein